MSATTESEDARTDCVLWPLNIANGSETVASGTSDTSFENKEAKAFDLLVNALDDKTLAYVAHVGTSSEVRKLLIDRYEARTYADVSHVVRELNTKTFRLFMDTRIDDDMLGRIILSSVKDIFPTTVEILRNREPPPTLQQIVDRLLSNECEEARSSNKRTGPVEDQVLSTSKTDNCKLWKQRTKDKPVLSQVGASCGQVQIQET
ncbi:unnamed protein product [Aphanomyces euteiches]